MLKSYSKEIFRPECNPGFESVHCIAHLDQDISGVLPYLNAVLGGFDYLKDPLDCQSLESENEQRIEKYMRQFKFEA